MSVKLFALAGILAGTLAQASHAEVISCVAENGTQYLIATNVNTAFGLKYSPAPNDRLEWSEIGSGELSATDGTRMQLGVRLVKNLPVDFSKAHQSVCFLPSSNIHRFVMNLTREDSSVDISGTLERRDSEACKNEKPPMPLPGHQKLNCRIINTN